MIFWQLNGRTIVKNDNGQRTTVFRLKKSIQYRSMRVGGIYAYTYSNLGQKVDVIKFSGFSDVVPKYGEGGPKFANINQVMKKYGVKSLKQLEDIDSKLGLEYGHGIYMCVIDILTGDQGCWFYPFEGAWTRGSGADRMSFFEIEQLR